MDEHHCLLCMGSNTNRYAQLSVAREALRTTFPDIHFGEMMETCLLYTSDAADE